MRRRLFSLSLLALVASAGAQQARIVTWNISDYTGGRTADIQNAVYGTFGGRSMSPDIILAQEIQSASAADAFKSALNTAGGSPGDWNYAYGALSATSDSVLFYRTSVASFVGKTQVAVGSSASTNQPRDTWRFDIKLGADTLALYDVHMKAGSASSDVDRRQVEATHIRDDANSLASNYSFLIGGDFNMQSSSQSPYQTLVGAGTNSRGRFYDPISTPGNWDNNESYKFVHTQDPAAAGGGGMDSRYDFLLGSASLFDGTGLDYVGDITKPFSTTTWNDPNHSYRVWGNDGTSYNKALTTTGNSMVGASIAQSLINCATTAGGHLPVYMDLKYQAVPEPTTIAALGLGLAAVIRRRKRS